MGGMNISQVVSCI